MELNNKTKSDDEDDLEQLRLAALQSLRKPAVSTNFNNSTVYIKIPQNSTKRGRGFQGRNPRNGQFNNRSRNTNLISIPTTQEPSNVDNSSLKKLNFNDNSGTHKLILPQDRYCNTNTSEEKSSEPPSKFDRYDNSDKSESESEYESVSGSESESPNKLERTNSLEALMKELENEIHGESKPIDDKPKTKNRIKKRKRKTSVNVPVDAETKVDEVKNLKLDIETRNKELLKDSVNVDKAMRSESPKLKSKPVRLPPQRTNFKKYPQRSIPYVSQTVPYAPMVFPTSQFNGPNLTRGANLPFNPLPVVPQLYLPNFERALSPLLRNTDDVLTITRAPLSPRSAAFVLQNREIIERRKKSPRRSYSRSPSPRYRRSKSPRIYRSPSRSPDRFGAQNIEKKGMNGLNKEKVSPLRDRKLSPGRKLSPRRIESPIRKLPISRKTSPSRQIPSRKTSPIRRISPNRISPQISPNRKQSPVRRLSPNRDKRSPPMRERSPYRRHPEKKSPRLSPREKSPKYNNRSPPKPPIRDRLGNKTVNEKDQSQDKSKQRMTLSPSPEMVQETNIDESLDPILEARKRKFESNEIQTKDGIIRLKPKNEQQENSDERVDELTKNELLEVEEEYLDTNVEDLFSDEETDEENEGRFKSNLNAKRNVSVMPFTQLLSDPSRNVKNESLLMQCRHRENKSRNRDRDRKRHRSRSPVKSRDERLYKERKNESKISDKKTKEGRDRLFLKNRILFRSEQRRDREKIAVITPVESKKIEIKIRNPAKYETTSKYDVANEHEILKIEKNARNVEVTKKEDSDLDDDMEIIIDKEDAEDATQKSDGDLRAQLSRKRAERQNKLPVAEDVQSRLLQNALQGAVFKKPKKSKEQESAPKEYDAVKRTATLTNIGYGVMKIKNNKFLNPARKVRFLYSDSELLADCTDGKLPIHLRLGFANNLDLFKESKSHKKRKKSKSRGGLEQV